MGVKHNTSHADIKTLLQVAAVLILASLVTAAL